MSKLQNVFVKSFLSKLLHVFVWIAKWVSCLWETYELGLGKSCCRTPDDRSVCSPAIHWCHIWLIIVLKLKNFLNKFQFKSCNANRIKIFNLRDNKERTGASQGEATWILQMNRKIQKQKDEERKIIKLWKWYYMSKLP